MVRNTVYKLLRRSEKYIGTDMVYLAKGGGWLGLSQGVGMLSSFLLIVAFSNMLDKEAFGTYRFVLSFLSIINIFSFPGIVGAVSQAVARKYDGFVKRGLIQRLYWEVTTFIIGTSIAIYYYANGNLILAGSFMIMAVLFPLMDALYIYRAVYHGKKNFRAVSVTEMLSRLGALVVITGTLFVTQNVVAIIFVYLFHQTVLRAIFLWYMFTHTPLNTAEDPKSPKYAKHLSVIGILSSISGQIDQILIFHFLGAAPLALYVLARVPIDQIRTVFGNIKTLAFPKFANQTDAHIKKYLTGKIRIFELYLIPIVALYIFSAPYIYSLFFPVYLESVIYSQVLSLALLAMPRSLISVMFNARMKVKELYILRTVGPLVHITVLTVTVMLYGMWGLVIGVLMSEYIKFFLHYILFKRM